MGPVDGTGGARVARPGYQLTSRLPGWAWDMWRERGTQEESWVLSRGDPTGQIFRFSWKFDHSWPMASPIPPRAQRRKISSPIIAANVSTARTR